MSMTAGTAVEITFSLLLLLLLCEYLPKVEEYVDSIRAGLQA